MEQAYVLKIKFNIYLIYNIVIFLPIAKMIIILRTIENDEIWKK